MTLCRSSRTLSACLWVALVCPSLFIVHKTAGWIGVVFYAPLSGIVIGYRHRFIVPPSSARALRLTAVATIALIVVAFVMIYPIVNVHTPGHGSDDDDAYNIGAKALMAGRSPYSERTYLNNQLHSLPGSFVLAIPFVLLGTSAWQNLFWILLFFFAVSLAIHDEREALKLAWLILIVSPTVLHQVLTGTAHVSNTIYVLLALWYLLRTRNPIIASVGSGIALASRANFILLLPLAFAELRRRRGLGVAVGAISVTLLTVVALSLPFYLHDPMNFGPLEAADRVVRFNTLVPYGGQLIVVAALGVATLLSMGPMTDARFCGSCAIVQAVPVVVGTALSTVQTRGVDLGYATYGTFAAWFVIMAVALSERDQRLAGLKYTHSAYRSAQNSALRQTL